MFKSTLRNILRKLGIRPVPFVTLVFRGWKDEASERRALNNVDWLDAEINAGRLGPSRPPGLFGIMGEHEPARIGDTLRVYFDPARCSEAAAVEYVAACGILATLKNG